MYICSKCGHSAEQEVRFCTQCGAQMIEVCETVDCDATIGPVWGMRAAAREAVAPVQEPVTPTWETPAPVRENVAPVWEEPAPVQQTVPQYQEDFEGTIGPAWSRPVQRTVPPVQQTAAPSQQATAPVQQTVPPVQRTVPPVQRTAAPVQAAAPQSRGASLGKQLAGTILSGVGLGMSAIGLMITGATVNTGDPAAVAIPAICFSIFGLPLSLVGWIISLQAAKAAPQSKNIGKVLGLIGSILSVLMLISGIATLANG